MTVSDSELQHVAGLARGVIDVGRSLNRHEIEASHGAVYAVEAYQNAVRAYTMALDQTIKYLNATRSNQQPRSEQEEYRLSALWIDASIAIGHIDQELANRCFIKGQGWLDPSVWTDPRFTSYGVSINDMREALLDFNKTHKDRQDTQPWISVVGALFAVATAISIGLYLFMSPDEFSPGKMPIFRAWFSLCVGCSAGFLGRAFAVGQIPIFKNAPLKFSAMGGAALFIVTYVLLGL